MFCTTCENFNLEYCYAKSECLVKEPLKKEAIILIESKNIRMPDKWALKNLIVPLMVEFHMEQSISNAKVKLFNWKNTKKYEKSDIITFNGVPCKI